MRLAADLYATNAYLAERALAKETGKPCPKPPKPHSRYVRSFARDFSSRLVDVFQRLTPEETKTIGAAIERRLDDEDASLVAALLLIVAMHPADAAQWIRTHVNDLALGTAS